ncbi:uncharacterized protein METZ01_LOCUS22896 [marine metagenome]|uniref:Uncharacterized protein n=1 Tax=marine metagenome TaxID=408172 RepID=A0A381PSL4_9ZZZZ|tara:strand:- start:494 stop:1114 length:621 start_codon:yes stop_codon:yes gene_type:complete
MHWVTGCVNTTIQEVREANTSLGSTESIVILSRKHKTSGETENDFVSCVSGKTGSGEDGLSVMSERDFMDELFPWFEPRTAPLNMKDLTDVISRPLISEKIRAIGVRYLVWVEGTTQRSEESGALQCTVVSGGIPACFGFLSWESGSDYEASVWDINRGINVGKVSSEASGTSIVPAIIVPIPFIARVQNQACISLAEQLKTFIRT